MKELLNRWSPLLEEDGATGGGEPAESVSEKKYDDKDVDEIVNKKFAKWKAQQAEEIAKAVEEAQKLAEMNAQEKAEHQRDELQKQLDALLRDKAIADMKTTARGMLKAEEINAPEEIIAALITDDAETTNEAVKAFAKMYKQAVQDGIKEALKGHTPTKGSSASSKTKEEILDIKDAYERTKAIEENLDLFQEYFNTK